VAVVVVQTELPLVVLVELVVVELADTKQQLRLGQQILAAVAAAVETKTQILLTLQLLVALVL
jgi:hypothetical protein